MNVSANTSVIVCYYYGHHDLVFAVDYNDCNMLYIFIYYTLLFWNVHFAGVYTIKTGL